MNVNNIEFIIFFSFLQQLNSFFYFLIWHVDGVDEHNVDIDSVDGLKKSLGSLLDDEIRRIVFLLDDEDDRRGSDFWDELLVNSYLFSFLRSIFSFYIIIFRQN